MRQATPNQETAQQRSDRQRYGPGGRRPAWLDTAKALYESGHPIRKVAHDLGVSERLLHLFKKYSRWDENLHIAHRESVLYPWRDTLRPLFENGAAVEELLRIAGLSKTRFLDLARRWGWDGQRRWEAFQLARREGMEREARDRLRKKRKRHARRARTKLDDRIPLRFLKVVEEAPVCTYCSRSLTRHTRTIDHIEPLSRGGTDAVDNLAPACMRCNREKRDLPLLVWLAHRAHARARAA